MSNILTNHRAELLRALDAFKYERAGDQIYFPESKVLIGGVFSHRRIENDVPGVLHVEPNIVTLAGLDDILKTYFASLAQHTAFNIAPFSGSVTPVNTWTAANFNANATEFTGYNESTRVAWTPDAEATQTIQNAATPSTFTITTGPVSVYGAALFGDSSAKLSTSGMLIAAVAFTYAQLNLTTASKLQIQYTITASSS